MPMRKVLARPWVGVRVCHLLACLLACLLFLVCFFLVWSSLLSKGDRSGGKVRRSREGVFCLSSLSPFTGGSLIIGPRFVVSLKLPSLLFFRVLDILVTFYVAKINAKVIS